jgi:hypothetical protein
MKDPIVKPILILELHMTNESVSNNCRSEGFGIQRSKDYLSRVLAESTKVFAQSLGVFTKSSYLLAKLVKKSI